MIILQIFNSNTLGIVLFISGIHWCRCVRNVILSRSIVLFLKIKVQCLILRIATVSFGISHICRRSLLWMILRASIDLTEIGLLSRSFILMQFLLSSWGLLRYCLTFSINISCHMNWWYRSCFTHFSYDLLIFSPTKIILLLTVTTNIAAIHRLITIY